MRSAGSLQRRVLRRCAAGGGERTVFLVVTNGRFLLYIPPGSCVFFLNVGLVFVRKCNESIQPHKGPPKASKTF